MSNNIFEDPRHLAIEFDIYCQERECPRCPFSSMKKHSCVLAWYQVRLGKNIEAFEEGVDNSPIRTDQLSKRARGTIYKLLHKQEFETITHDELKKIKFSEVKSTKNCSIKTISELANYYNVHNIKFADELL